MVVCYTPRDIYSDNGNILLLPRGTKITGESLSDVKQGQTRIAIIWNQAKTRDGVIISLKNSNGTDALGRSGVEGYSESHFFERFGSAIAVSLLQTTTQTAAQNLIPRNGGNSLNISTGGNGGGTEIIESILDQYKNIPVSIVKNEGESIRIAINKNLDFSSVYELEVKP
jgi:type IV secretion system protein VirB10